MSLFNINQGWTSHWLQAHMAHNLSALLKAFIKLQKDCFIERRCSRSMQVDRGVRRVAEVVGWIQPSPVTGD